MVSDNLEEQKAEETPAPDVMTQSDIDALMSQYAAPAKSVDPIEEPEAAEKPGLSDQPSATISADPDAPFGRYVKGPKKGQPRTKPAPNQPKQPVVAAQLKDVPDAEISGMLIDGGLFLTLIDLIIPLAISIVNNHFSDSKIKPDELQMTADQKKQLTPVCDRVMKQLSLSGNPMVILLIGMFSVYGLNFMAAKMQKS